MRRNIDNGKNTPGCECGRYLHSLATDIEERLDVEVVCCQDDFEEHLLVNLNELGVPVRDIGCTSARFFCVVRRCGWVVAVMRAVLEDLCDTKVAFRLENLDLLACMESLSVNLPF